DVLALLPRQYGAGALRVRHRPATEHKRRSVTTAGKHRVADARDGVPSDAGFTEGPTASRSNTHPIGRVGYHHVEGQILDVVLCAPVVDRAVVILVVRGHATPPRARSRAWSGSKGWRSIGPRTGIAGGFAAGFAGSGRRFGTTRPACWLRPTSARPASVRRARNVRPEISFRCTSTRPCAA